ncbi:MAG: DUF4241 domain-containing protein [Gordonia polyisoprenivorans]|nr:DUF4241 domain-containing protein [Gordonia polyisoprenivorans]
MCDPFTSLTDPPLTFAAPPGLHRVAVTWVNESDPDEDERMVPAYLSVQFTDAPTATAAYAQPLDFLPVNDDAEPPLVGVDAGLIAFVDPEAARACGPTTDDWRPIFLGDSPTSWSAQLDASGRGAAVISLPNPRNGENVVITSTGGDGSFPVLATLAADGSVTGLHIDLLVAFAYTMTDTERAVHDAHKLLARCTAQLRNAQTKTVRAVAEHLPARVSDAAKATALKQPSVVRALSDREFAAMRDALSSVADSMATDLINHQDTIPWTESYSAQSGFDDTMTTWFQSRVAPIHKVLRDYGFASPLNIPAHSLFDSDDIDPSFAKALDAVKRARTDADAKQAADDRAVVDERWS